MKIWMSDTIFPTDPDIDWLVIPRVKTQKGYEELEEYLNDREYTTLGVDLYSVDDVDWLENLEEGAKALAAHIGLDTWTINCHVHTDNQEAIDFIINSSCLKYVPLIDI